MIDKKAIEESGRRASRKATKQKQKENLRTLVENSSVSKIRSTGRILKYGTASFVRNVWLSIAATLVMTVTLVILLVTVGASLVLSATAETIRQHIDITVYFAPLTSSEDLETMADILRADPNVNTVTVSDSVAEYNKLLEDNRDNESLLATLEDEEMYQIMLSATQAAIRIKVHNPEDLSSIRNIVDNTPLFQTTLDPTMEPTYNVNQTEIKKINSWAAIAKNGGIILGIVFLVISVLVIFNTIRMAIFSRREEIYMMRLVGADTSFIRGPFLVEAQISSIIAGILASTIAFVAFKLLAPSLSAYGINVSTVATFIETNRLVIVYAVVIGIGILIGTISARLAMQKYLK